MTDNSERSDLITFTGDIVAAHVANNSVAVGDVAGLIATVHAALSSLGLPSAEALSKQPAVAIRSSIKSGHLVCLVCGAKLKTLKRHLATSHGFTSDQYRTEYQLPASYPMTSADYSEMRRGMAKSIGLGRKRATPTKRKAIKKP